jgi:SAM-dependent methyltransferase
MFDFLSTHPNVTPDSSGPVFARHHDAHRCVAGYLSDTVCRMGGTDEDGWSAVAAEWAELWGDFAEPARLAIVAATGIGTGSRVLDIGCGSGEFLVLLDQLGAVPTGIDPAPGMIAVARSRTSAADIRLGSAEELPWPDDSFDVVTAFNSLQFADDILDALTEAARVTVPRGFVAIANWADRDRNDFNVIDSAVARAAGEDQRPDGFLRQPGGLEQLFADGGLEVVASGLLEAPWEVPDDDTLVRGVLLGEDEAAIVAAVPTVLEAARPFRTASGGYRLVNAFRYAVGRTDG